MRNSTRAALALGLGLVGVAGLVVPSMGQQPADTAVRPAAGNSTAAQPKAPTPAPAAVIGVIDLEGVLKNYDKFKVGMEGIEADAMARSNELMKLQNEAGNEVDKLKRLKPGDLDQKKIEERLGELKIRMQTGKEQAQMDLSRKEAEVLATTYGEIQRMADGVAKQRGMNLVVQASATPPTASNPKSIEAALFRTVITADPKLDITRDVTYYLNYWYKKSGGPAPKNREQPDAPGASPAPAAAANPAAGVPR